MNNSESVIVFIDSGIGGLSVLQEMILQMPSYSYVYIMDNEMLPYGNLNIDVLNARLESLIIHILQYYSPNAIVLACNTASTQSLSFLRQQFNIPFVGVVPAIKPAAKIANQIAILATPATVKSHYLSTLIEDFAPKATIQLYGSTELVELAEAVFWEEQFCDIRRSCLNSELTNILSYVDVAVLGCTHFPFLTGYLSQCVSNELCFVDSSSAVVMQIKRVVQDELCVSASKPLKKLVYTSEIGREKKSVLMKKGIFEEFIKLNTAHPVPVLSHT